MTRVEFFFNLDDKWLTLTELTEKAFKKDRRILLFTPQAAVSTEVAQRLWSFAPTSFIPNCYSHEPHAAETAVVVAHQGDGQETILDSHHDILINLCPSIPPFFSRFTRLIELVSHEEPDKIEARKRFKFYRDRGYEIKTYDAQGRAL